MEAELPGSTLLFKRLVLGWAQAGRREHALAILEEAVARWPDDFQFQLLRAVWLADAGDRPAALAALAIARRLRPADPALDGGLEGAVRRLTPLLHPPGRLP